MKYVTYNRIYKNGKAQGSVYTTFDNRRTNARTFSSRSAALNAANKTNNAWNRINSKARNKIQAKVVKVVAVRKRIARRANVGARSGLEYLGLR